MGIAPLPKCKAFVLLPDENATPSPVLGSGIEVAASLLALPSPETTLVKSFWVHCAGSSILENNTLIQHTEKSPHPVSAQQLGRFLQCAEKLGGEGASVCLEHYFPFPFATSMPSPEKAQPAQIETSPVKAEKTPGPLLRRLACRISSLIHALANLCKKLMGF